MKKIIYSIVFLLFIYFVLNWYVISTTQKGSIYIVPEGYKGKLSIVYNQKDQPVLEEKDGYQVVKFPLNGLVKTSNHPRIGKQRDKYFYYTKNGKFKLAKDIKLEGGLTTEDKNDFLYTFWIR